MTQYERILFLDADVLPLTNLDYLFELSHGPNRIFKDNIIIPSRTLPMIAGFFVLKPNRTAYEILLNVIEEKFHAGKLGIQFDKINGWGHRFLGENYSDYWISNNDAHGTEWNYYGACTDQGLFYHYPKYMAQSMTQILSRRIINYGPSGTGGPEVVHIEKEWKFRRVEDSPLYNFSINHYDFERPECTRVTKMFCSPQYRDHAHFMGPDIKPWKRPPLYPIPNPNDIDNTKNRPQEDLSSQQPKLTAHHLWWETVASLQYEDHIDTEYLITFQ